MRSWKRQGDDLPMSEAMPVDVMPASNGEFIPGEPTRGQRAVMALQDEEAERTRRRLGMTRRQFVRSAAGMGVGFWAINQVMPTRFGAYNAYAAPPSNRACDLEFPEAQLDNLDGEFIFDVQSHHIDSGGDWRVTNPGFHAAFSVLWEQSGPLGEWPALRDDNSVRGFGDGGEIDPIENLSLFHYLKELYLDSSTTMTVLSAVPSENDRNPLPVNKAAQSLDIINGMAQSQRAVMHAFVMPNRGSAGNVDTDVDPVFMAEEFRLMEQYVADHGDKIRGWKVYTPWGDVPGASGWFLDDHVGQKFIDKVTEMGERPNGPNKLIACHKGFALPAFDQRAASPRDIGVAAKRNPEVDFLVYHSGFDGEEQTAYPGDDTINSADRGVDCFIKSLRENGYDASRFADGNVPNVYAEIGATLRSVMGSPDELGHLLGKLITHVGPRRVVYGTDSLWFGSPQSVIVGFRLFEFSDEAKALYDLPHGLEGDRFDPQVLATDPSRSIRNGIFGRNAAEVYGIDADAQRKAISCDEVQKIRDAYILNPATPAQVNPGASNTMPAARSRRELLKSMAGKSWGP